MMEQQRNIKFYVKVGKSVRLKKLTAA